MAAKSWKERRQKLQQKTKDSAENREGKASTILSFKGLDGREVKWVDKVKHGRDPNKFDILPFEVTQDWYETMRKFSGKPTGLVPGDVDYKLEFAIHNNVGPEQQRVLCLLETFGLPCPVCEERARLLDSPEEDPEGKLAEAIKPKWRTLYNIIDLNADDEIRLWEQSYHLFEKTLMTEVYMGDEGLDLFWDIEDGKTVEWRGKEKSWLGRKFVECDRVDFTSREPYPDSILDEVYPLDTLLVIPTYDQVAAIMIGPLGEAAKSPKTSRADRTEKKDEGRRQRFKKEEEKPEPESEKENKPSSDDKCPMGRIFGEDFNQHPECQKCKDEDYNTCEEEHNAEPEPEPKPEPEPEETQRRQRKRPAEEPKDDPAPSGRRRRR